VTHWKSLSPGKYLTANEFNGRTPTFTITGARGELMPVMDDGKGKGEKKDEAKERDKGVVYFTEIDRGLVLNKTNGTCLEAMFGPDVEGWVGKRVTLHAVPVQVGPKRELGIRVVGSPDLKQLVVATIVAPRKKPVDIRLMPTGGEKKPADGGTP
jgi:hypothetical protein